MNFLFSFIDIRCLFLKYKTAVLSNNQSDDGHAISRQEKRWLPKITARFLAKKGFILLPPLGSGCLGNLPPLSQSLYGQAYGRTLTSEPKFRASLSYQTSLPMVGSFDRVWTLYGSKYKLESLKSLEGNKLDTQGLKAAQWNEIIVSIHSIFLIAKACSNVEN